MYMGATPSTPPLIPGPANGTDTSWVSQIAVPLLQLYRERQTIKAQTARAAAGLPPLQADQLSPAVRVDHRIGVPGLDRSTLILGAGALAAAGLVYLLTRKR